MNFDATSFLLSLFISSVGFVLLAYGRKMSRPPHLVSGLILLVFPYFVPSPATMSAIAIAVIGAFWVAVKWGW
jgi:hypothetical protein